VLRLGLNFQGRRPKPRQGPVKQPSHLRLEFNTLICHIQCVGTSIRIRIVSGPRVRRSQRKVLDTNWRFDFQPCSLTFLEPAALITRDVF
jgi:hypothetical protein